jgi:hypothetical protein
MQHFTVTKTEAGGWDNPELARYFKEVPAGKRIVISIADDAKEKPGQSPNASLSKIETDLNHLETLCGTQIDYNDVTAVMFYLNDLSSWLSYSGKLRADIYALNLQARAVQLIKILDDQMYSSIGPLERKEHAKALCWETEAMLLRAERVNAAITHRCDHMRTFISFHKQEMTLSTNQQG